MLLACDSGTVPADSVYGCIDSIYASIVSALRSIADTCITKCRKGFFKFWWNEDLSLHKRASVDSDRLWKGLVNLGVAPSLLIDKAAALNTAIV